MTTIERKISILNEMIREELDLVIKEENINKAKMRCQNIKDWTNEIVGLKEELKNEEGL